MGSFLIRLCGGLVATNLWAQLVNVEIGGGALIPIGGYQTNVYSAGPALRPGFEFRPWRLLGAEAGFTEGWPRGEVCSRFGCEHPREALKLVDYGFRGHIPLRANRVDLSLGVGGGYIWYENGNSFDNGWLLQYSGKAAVALDARRRWRIP